MTGNFDNVNQLLLTIKRTVGLPNFSFREIKSTGKYEIIFGKYEGITFPSEEIPSTVGFTGIPDGRRVPIGYKMGTFTSNKLRKSDETDETNKLMKSVKHTLENSMLNYAREST